MRKTKEIKITTQVEIKKLIRLHDAYMDFRKEMKIKYGVNDGYLNGIVRRSL